MPGRAWQLASQAAGGGDGDDGNNYSPALSDSGFEPLALCRRMGPLFQNGSVVSRARNRDFHFSSLFSCK